jgi:tRNA(Ile2) C34 agmatinyltransferase TiaS
VRRGRVVSRAIIWSVADSVKCPKCGYERRPTDSAPQWQCPSCQVAYVKAAQVQDVSAKPRLQPTAHRVQPTAQRSTVEPAEVDSDELTPPVSPDVACSARIFQLQAMLKRPQGKAALMIDSVLR